MLKVRKTKEQFIEDAHRVHGDKYDYSKVEYKTSKDKVCIVCPIHGEFWQTPNDHLSGHSCRRCSRKLGKVFGVGVNDCYELIRKGDKISSCYQAWTNMLQRCYSLAWHKKYPTYIGCQVCEEWLYYSKFKKWYEENYREGFELDKDILIDGERVYGPKTCAFVPHYINSIARKHRRKKIPSYTNKAYKHKKEIADKALACGDIDERVYNALLKWDFSINTQ